MTDLNKLALFVSETLTANTTAPDEGAVESLRLKSLGKKGFISEQLKLLGSMDPERRKIFGPEINQAKEALSSAFAQKKAALADAALEARLAGETLDVTLPVRESGLETGRIHPVSQVTDELTAIFAGMGFSVAEGPDIETDELNFTALNFPVGHPAREMHDTFFLPAKENGERLLLRTHTSPVQVRTMRSVAPPIRVICPGRTYRFDMDQTHTPMFHQVEAS